MKKKFPAIFLDRDGTILTERGYLADPQKMVFYRNIFPGLKKLTNFGFKLVVVTNQSGVGRGFFSLKTLKVINKEFRLRLLKKGIRLGGIYFCPHLPTDGCRCRKPRPFLPKKAARDLNLDLDHSYVIGDQDRDIQLAKNIGAKGILVLTGAGRSHRRKMKSIAVKVAQNLGSACRWIIKKN